MITKIYHNSLKKNISKYLLLFSIYFLVSCSSSKEFSQFDDIEGKYIETGEASWYGPNFHGLKTANGEIYNQFDLTAAHRTLAFESIIRVVNISNGKSVIVRINDRGPYAKNRIIDLSRKAAKEIGMIESGFTEVRLCLLNNSTLPKDLKVPHYTIQIASYKQKSDAIIHSKKISNSRVVKTIVNGEKYFRVYVGNYTNKNDAIKQKEFLQNEGIDGFVKQIEN